LSRLPRLTAKQPIRAPERNGYRVVRTSGSHTHLAHPSRPGRLTIPVHTGKVIGPGLLHAILRQARLRPEDLD